MSHWHAAWDQTRCRVGASLVIAALAAVVLAPATVGAPQSFARRAPAPPGLDHFKCYEAQQQPALRRAAVKLADQFGTTSVRVTKTGELCNPASKDASKIRNRRAHLVCYETSEVGTEPFRRRVVQVTNQFGVRKLTVVAPATLCLPSLKRKGSSAPTGRVPANALDHFRCYDVKTLSAPKTVKTRDQFKRTNVATKILDLVSLCVPVSKNGERVRRPKAHLVCYSIKREPFTPLAVRVRNQFGLASLKVIGTQALCLPSFKKVLTAG